MGVQFFLALYQKRKSGRRSSFGHGSSRNLGRAEGKIPVSFSISVGSVPAAGAPAPLGEALDLLRSHCQHPWHHQRYSSAPREDLGDGEMVSSLLSPLDNASCYEEHLVPPSR